MEHSTPPEPAAPTTSAPAPRVLPKIVAVALVVVSAVAGTGLARWLRQPASAQERPAIKEGIFPEEAKLFQGWRQPDLAIVITGQQNGYLLPCGCSRPQYGGLERRYNLIAMMKKAGWAVVPLDVGDVPQAKGPAELPNQQGLIKYRYAMEAMELMGYDGVGFGRNEIKIRLSDALADFSLQTSPIGRPREVLASNLIDAETNYPLMTKPWRAVEPVKGIRVGATQVIGSGVAASIKDTYPADKTLKFERTPDAVTRALVEMIKDKVNLPVMLYQGPMVRPQLGIPAGGKAAQATEALALAEAFPQIPIVVCTSEEDEPPTKPTEVVHKDGTKSLVITVGQKAKYVGVLGVYRTGKKDAPFAFKYEKVRIGEEFITPAAALATQPVAKLMEAYTKELKDKNYLAQYGQIKHLLQAMGPVNPPAGKNVPVAYAGTEACKKCHREAYDVWKKSGHSHAYKTLEGATNPGNRQFDPECIVCHTVGFGYQSGYVNEAKTPNLKDVGCESCHGPSSMHVANPNDVEWQKRINPWRHLPANKRELAMDLMCQKCHDIDNDVNWKVNKAGQGGFQRKWPQIAHPTPKD